VIGVVSGMVQIRERRIERGARAGVIMLGVIMAAGLTLGLAVVSVMSPAPSVRFEYAGTTAVVTAVDIGSDAWERGVRAGQPVVGTDPAQVTGSAWQSIGVRLADGSILTVLPGPDSNVIVLLLTAVAVFLASVIISLRSWPWAGVGVIVSLIIANVESADLGVVARLSVASLPIVIALAVMLVTTRTTRAILTVIGVVIGAVLVIDVGAAGTAGDAWPLAQGLSTVLVIALLGVLLFSLLIPSIEVAADRRQRLGGRAGFGRLLLDEMVPGRSWSLSLAASGERSRLAGELHGEAMPGVLRAIEAAERNGSDQTIAADLRTTYDALRTLVDERQSLTVDLRGLVCAIEVLAERVEDSSGIEVRLNISEDGSRPPQAVERAAVRICQLAFDNVVGHAHGCHIEVNLDVSASHLRVTIVDDGVGFDPLAQRSTGRLGFADMQAQAGAVGGHLNVDSGLSLGTKVEFRWTR
jgi:signal transduction histidine kinase